MNQALDFEYYLLATNAMIAHTKEFGVLKA